MGGPAGPHLDLSGEEIRRVARVEALLLALSPDASPLLPPAVYALPLLRVLREAIDVLDSCAGSRLHRRMRRILERLVAYFETYDSAAPRLRLAALGNSPAHAVARWTQLLRELAEEVDHFRQRTVQLQLLRAFSVAVTPDQSEAARRLCVSSSLRRQLDTERIGLGQRCHGDSHTELGAIALKLSGRAAQLRSLAAPRSLPPVVVAAADEMLDAAAEMARRAFGDEANSDRVAFEIRSLFDHTIRPGHGRLETAVESLAPAPGDKDLRRKLDALREAAARLLWTAEDLTDGFFRGRRNVGLRWLVGRRSGERENDLFSPD
jgi:hypothetical protein